MPSLRLTPKVTLAFVIFAAALLLSVGVLAYSSGRGSLEAATISELASTATEKEAAFNAWIDNGLSRLAALSSLSAVREHVSALVSTGELASHQLDHDRLISEFQASIQKDAPFLTLFVLDPDDGRIIASTSPDDEGRFKEDRAYFINGRLGPYVQNVYYALDIQGPAMTVSAPVQTADGRLLAVLAGQLNLDVMSAIINRHTQLHRSDDAFLVNPSNLFLTQPRFISDTAILRRGDYTDTVKQCLAGNSGSVLADDYRQIPSIIVYRWLPERQLCLIVKLDQSEAFEPSRTFGVSLLAISVGALLAASIVAILLARTITRPVLALQSGVERFGQGDLNVRLPEISTDELGSLAHEFNTMADAIVEKEKLLAQERNLLRTLIDTLPDYIFVKDKLGKFMLMNAAHANVVGLASPDDAVGKTDFDLFPKELAEQYYADEQIIIQSGQPLVNREEPSADHDRNPIFLATSKVPLRDQRNAIIGIVGISHDVTERKRIEDEVRTLNADLEQRVIERTTRLAFLAEASAILSESFDYLTCLKKLAQLAVPQIADWCAIDILEDDGLLHRLAVVHTDPAKVDYAYELQRRYPPDPNASTGTYRVLKSGQSEMITEITDEMLVAVVKDPELLAIMRDLGLKSTITVSLKARGQGFGVLSLIMAESGRHYTMGDRDLAEDLARRAALLIDNAKLYYNAQQLNTELEQRVANRTAELVSSNKELEAFSYSVSHDLRAPLRALDGFSEVLHDDYADVLDDEGRSHLNRIRAASQRMGHLIDDLIALSRLNRTEMRYESVDLSHLAEQIAVELRAAQPEQSVEFVIQPSLVVQGDSRLLRIMLVNLLTNAWKFTSKTPNPHVEFGKIEKDGTPIYFVRDNGAGFDMAYVDKLFGAFQRLHKPTEFEGTGIGLATVQRVILRHGGKIWAEGVVNKGATFYFSFQNHELIRSNNGSS